MTDMVHKEPKEKKISIPSMEQVEKEREKRKSQKEYQRMLMRTCGVLVVVAAVSVLIATKFLPVLQVSGTSMEPVLLDGDVVVLRKTEEVKPGDLIGFYYQSKVLLKRVIGTAGDDIVIDEDGNVYVNDQRLEEDYVTEKALGECSVEFPYQVPDGKVFVLGDCREISVDSRNSEVGCVEKEQIVGKAMFCIWPFRRMRFF